MYRISSSTYQRLKEKEAVQSKKEWEKRNKNDKEIRTWSFQRQWWRHLKLFHTNQQQSKVSGSRFWKIWVWCIVARHSNLLLISSKMCLQKGWSHPFKYQTKWVKIIKYVFWIDLLQHIKEGKLIINIDDI